MDLKPKRRKLYACSVCEKAFISPSHLEKHFRVHTGERPFKCEICQMSFKTQADVNSHSTVHSIRGYGGPWGWPGCSYCSRYRPKATKTSNHSCTPLTSLLNDNARRLFTSAHLLTPCNYAYAAYGRLMQVQSTNRSMAQKVMKDPHGGLTRL